MCLQFVNFEKILKYDIAKIYVFQPQNPIFFYKIPILRQFHFSKNYY